jgi:hypothetical protein
LSPQRRAPDALGYFPNSFSTHWGELGQEGGPELK